MLAVSCLSQVSFAGRLSALSHTVYRSQVPEELASRPFPDRRSLRWQRLDVPEDC